MKPTDKLEKVKQHGYISSWNLPDVDLEEIVLALRNVKGYATLVTTNPSVIPKVYDALEGMFIVLSPFLNKSEVVKSNKKFEAFLKTSQAEYTKYRLRRMNGLNFTLSSDYVKSLREMRLLLQQQKFLSGLGVPKSKVDVRTNAQKLNRYLMGD